MTSSRPQVTWYSLSVSKYIPSHMLTVPFHTSGLYLIAKSFSSALWMDRSSGKKRMHDKNDNVYGAENSDN